MRALLSALLLLPACFDRDGYEFVPGPDPNNPGLVHLGELTISPVDAITDNVIYGTLGPVEPGKYGGATASFIGTGGEVCVWVDPEAVFWNQAIAIQGKNNSYAYPDNVWDDGDLDLEVGLSAFYTGSPGVELGDFKAVFEDSLGNESYIEFNECTIADWYGQSGGHAGRGSVEFCTIDTSAHPGKEYTIVLETFSLPLDDFSLGYGLVVFEGDCNSVNDVGYRVTSPAGNSVTISASYPTGECLLRNEAGSADFTELELAYCADEQTYYCCTNPDNSSCADEDVEDNDICPEEYINDFGQ